MYVCVNFANAIPRLCTVTIAPSLSESKQTCPISICILLDVQPHFAAVLPSLLALLAHFRDGLPSASFTPGLFWGSHPAHEPVPMETMASHSEAALNLGNNNCKMWLRKCGFGAAVQLVKPAPSPVDLWYLMHSVPMLRTVLVRSPCRNLQEGSLTPHPKKLLQWMILPLAHPLGEVVMASCHLY